MGSDFNHFNFLVLMAVLGIMPILVTVVTSYCKIVIVLSLIRNALGVQQTPPGMVLAALSMILSVFIMAPVGKQIVDDLDGVQFEDKSIVEMVEDLNTYSKPLKDFLIANTDVRITKAFVNASKKIWPEEMRNSIKSDNYLFVIPSFVISELTKAFQIGFLLYLPFIAIDLIISNILLAMGMMMVSPMSISLPFKLMLFVSLDGWLKLTQGLMYSYSY
ncbi:type III secretion system export apparatus subunit SctR [Succinivibrio dextrinosolvens]|uniref:Type III secretion protein R n=1 Tax=Succinivibrio dextrinosolvens TaxID=83771 RepID=A0A662ZAK0_9GAMM|nr:type III secretion system export apparatus subunit SctR [Succinivibrio dextrinosolvens]SFK02833.1 type III secretion protein R [Succinivibrio dextrinosolvens]